MNNKFAIIGILASAVVLVGCNSGTTYGTGKSHEAQTLESMYNMLSVKPPDTPNIDYSARPDLVMPASKQALPAPGTGQEVNDGEQWPVSPEERIAAVREAAPEADERSGELPIEYLTSEKTGIRVSRKKPSDFGRLNDRGPAVASQDIINEIRDESNGTAASDDVKRKKEQLAYSTGVKRKYLTEPPSIYRQPAETAEAGDLGLTSEELAERIKKAQEEERNLNRDLTKLGTE